MGSGGTSRDSNWLLLGWRRFRELARELRASPLLLTVFAVLLFVDLAWILWFVVTKSLYNAGVSSRWYEMRHLRIVEDRSYPEIFNYGKTLVLILLLAHLSETHRRWVYASIAILFAVVLADDAMMIHEELGALFALSFDVDPAFPVRRQDVGEVLVWALLGLLLAPLVLISLMRTPAEHRANGLALLVPFVALLFCAIVVDQLYHANSDRFPGAGVLLDAIEDGGEMVAITVACVVAAAIARRLAGDATTPQD